MRQAIESRATRQITERRGRVLTSNSQDVPVPSTFSYASYSGIVAYGEHAFEKYDSRWDPMRISIPGNINDRVSIGTRNKSNGACSSRQWSCASCIHLRPSSVRHHWCALSRSYPIYFTSTFYSIFSSTQRRSRFIDRTRTYTLTKPGYIRGLLRNRIFAARGGRKISEYLERFRLNSTKYPRIFRQGLWIFRSCYWHTPRWNLFTTSLMATLSCLS